MTRNLRSNSFNSLWRIQLVSLIVMLLLSVGNFQTQEQTAYAQGSICTDRPANERSTPPATIWVEVETHYSEWGETGPVAKEVTFDFYISGVLLGELGDSPDDITNANLPSNNGLWEDAVLEAMAVAIRSFTWFRLNYAGQFPDPYDPHAITRDNTNQCGFWDEKIDSGQQINAQTFRPFQAGVSQAIKDHYFDIVTQHVPNIYLVEANGTHPIDAQYRATVGENSDPGGKSYLVSIFDPISAGDTDPTNASGMGQWGAQRWAMGLNDNNVRFPRWESYEQVLFHYYANAHLKVVNGAILTPAYRWNPLTVNWSGGAVDPPTMYSGNTYNVTLHLQNSGEAEWGSDVKLVYYWLRNGSRVTNSTLVDVDNLDEGDDDNNKNLSVHVPGSFQNGEAVTLMIDLRRTGDSSGRYFSNRESSRPWFNLRYNLCLGGDCLSYLPIILKGHTPPAPCSHNQQLIVNNGFENGYPPTPWVEVSPYQIVYNGVSAHSGSWHAYMAGYPNANDKLYQNFNLPAGTTGAILDYYFQLGTYDNDPPAHHFLYVYLRTAGGQTIQLLDQLDNTALLDVWHHRVINIHNLSSWADRDLRLSFEADNDNSSVSAFHVDDVNLKVNCNLTSGVLAGQPISTQEPAQFPAQVEKPAELRIEP